MSIKLLAGDLPVGQVIFLLSLPGALIFAIWARVQGHRWFSSSAPSNRFAPSWRAGSCSAQP
jgi:hypothetical protein